MKSVAIIWLNYNSMPFIDVVKASLRSLAELDYDRYFVYIVDNGSQDGSFEEIVKFVNNSNLRNLCKIVRLGRNLGFDGAIDIVWKTYILKNNYDYLLLMNNDAIALPDSLHIMVEYAETIPRLCGLQGAVEHGDTGTLDNMGMYIDSLLHSVPFLRGRKVSDLPQCCLYITYAGGAYALYRIDALKKIQLKGNDLFPQQAFGYWDDDLIGILAWMNNLVMVAIPKLTCKHMESLTFRRLGLREYFSTRNYLAKILTTKTRYKTILIAIAIKYAIRRYIRAILRGSKIPPGTYLRALYDGIVLSRRVKQMYNLKIDFSKVPIVDHGMFKTFKYLIFYRSKRFDIEEIERKIIEKYSFKCS